MDEGGYRPGRLTRGARLALLVAGLSLLALLATAWGLTPSEQGYGTHRQLGFPPCSFMVMFGRRCPSCGMTTSWSLLMHGRPLAAARANSGGAALGLVSLAAAPWLVASAVRGKWMWRRPSDRVLIAVSLAVVAITLGDWCCRLAMEPAPKFTWPPVGASPPPSESIEGVSP